jgi:hypothetical protein
MENYKIMTVLSATAYLTGAIFLILSLTATAFDVQLASVMGAAAFVFLVIGWTASVLSLRREHI